MQKCFFSEWCWEKPPRTLKTKCKASDINFLFFLTIKSRDVKHLKAFDVKKSHEEIPDGSKAEGHEQQNCHYTHGSPVTGRVIALKQNKRKKNRLQKCSLLWRGHCVTWLLAKHVLIVAQTYCWVLRNHILLRTMGSSCTEATAIRVKACQSARLFL